MSPTGSTILQEVGSNAFFSLSSICLITSGVPPAAPSHPKYLTVAAAITGNLLSCRKVDSFVVIIININVKQNDSPIVLAQFLKRQAKDRQNKPLDTIGSSRLSSRSIILFIKCSSDGDPSNNCCTALLVAIQPLQEGNSLLWHAETWKERQLHCYLWKNKGNFAYWRTLQPIHWIEKVWWRGHRQTAQHNSDIRESGLPAF